MSIYLPWYIWSVLGVGLLAASLMDIRSRRIPNVLTVTLLLLGLIGRGAYHGWAAAGWGLCGGAVGLGLLMYPFARGWIGAGDAKLTAAMGGWLGPLHVVIAVLVGLVVNGIVSVIYLLRSPAELKREIVLNLKLTLLTKSTEQIPEASTRPKSHTPPHAPALALGCAATLLVFSEQLLNLPLWGK